MIFIVTETMSWSEHVLQLVFADLAVARDQVEYLTRGNDNAWAHDIQDDGSETHTRACERGTHVVKLMPERVYDCRQNV